MTTHISDPISMTVAKHIDYGKVTIYGDIHELSDYICKDGVSLVDYLDNLFNTSTKNIDFYLETQCPDIISHTTYIDKVYNKFKDCFKKSKCGNVSYHCSDLRFFPKMEEIGDVIKDIVFLSTTSLSIIYGDVENNYIISDAKKKRNISEETNIYFYVFDRVKSYMKKYMITKEIFRNYMINHINKITNLQDIIDYLIEILDEILTLWYNKNIIDNFINFDFKNFMTMKRMLYKHLYQIDGKVYINNKEINESTPEDMAIDGYVVNLINKVSECIVSTTSLIMDANIIGKIFNLVRPFNVIMYVGYYHEKIYNMIFRKMNFEIKNVHPKMIKGHGGYIYFEIFRQPLFNDDINMQKINQISGPRTISYLYNSKQMYIIGDMFRSSKYDKYTEIDTYLKELFIKTKVPITFILESDLLETNEFNKINNSYFIKLYNIPTNEYVTPIYLKDDDINKLLHVFYLAKYKNKKVDDIPEYLNLIKEKIKIIKPTPNKTLNILGNIIKNYSIFWINDILDLVILLNRYFICLTILEKIENIDNVILYVNDGNASFLLDMFSNYTIITQHEIKPIQISRCIKII